MESSFGSSWAFALLPALFGFGLLLSVLSRRPPKAVGIAGFTFAGVCLVITFGMMVDGYKHAESARKFAACMRSQAAKTGSVEECWKIGPSNMGFVGNEAYES